MPDEDDGLQSHYGLGFEEGRLDRPLGIVELERTKELMQRHLSPPPAQVADIGGGPGRYAAWLASLGYEVVHRDLVPLHVEQALAAAKAAGVNIDAAVGDARELDLPDQSVDAVLLLGPLYHLDVRADRLRCLAEARRILKPGGVAFVAAISRWAPRLHGEVIKSLYREYPNMRTETPGVEATGVLPPLFPGSFLGFCHRPDELRGEVEDAGLECVDLVSVEGIAFALPDLEARLQDDLDRAVVFDAARATERVPELLGLGPHLLATARRR
jgi:SAM-dependent methyltransferase